MLTILLGLIISVVTDRISKTQILQLTANNERQSNDTLNEKSNQKRSEIPKISPAVFIVEKYRKKSQPNHNLQGFDNMGLKMEEV